MDVGTLVVRATTQYWDRIAVESEEGNRTFGEIGSRIFQLSRALKALGLQEEDRVLDLQFNQITYIESDLGISSAGLCRVALNYRLHPNDWVRIANDCGAKVLIMDHKFWVESAPVRELVDHIIHSRI
jgi:acyl-CoA synthetase (AMP-forming)/AMP-acid ligase II